jgi:hypothetical protein
MITDIFAIYEIRKQNYYVTEILWDILYSQFESRILMFFELRMTERIKQRSIMHYKRHRL